MAIEQIMKSLLAADKATLATRNSPALPTTFSTKGAKYVPTHRKDH